MPLFLPLVFFSILMFLGTITSLPCLLWKSRARMATAPFTMFFAGLVHLIIFGTGSILESQRTPYISIIICLLLAPIGGIVGGFIGFRLSKKWIQINPEE